MIAHKKTATWASSLRHLSLPKHFPGQFACALEGTLDTGQNCLLITCYLPQDLAKHTEACLVISKLTTTYPIHLIIPEGDFQGDWTSSSNKSCHLRTLPFTLSIRRPTTPQFQPNTPPNTSNMHKPLLNIRFPQHSSTKQRYAYYISRISRPQWSKSHHIHTPTTSTPTIHNKHHKRTIPTKIHSIPIPKSTTPASPMVGGNA